MDVSVGQPGPPLDPHQVTVDAGPVALDAMAQPVLGRSARHEVVGSDELAGVDRAWAAVANRYAPLTREIDALVAQARGVGLDELAEPLAGALADAARDDLSDPLTAAPGGTVGAATQARLDDLTRRVGTLRERVGVLVGVREAYPRRVAQLRALLDEVAAAEERLAAAYARATAKIADAGLPPAGATVAVLRARLGDLDRLYHGAAWSQLADAAAALEAGATRSRERAEEQRQLADGLVARRDELRGRLEAYRAKAAAWSDTMRPVIGV